MDLITVRDLHFTYSRKKVLDGLNLRVPPNSIYGFLGPNGSGKTTTIRLLLGLVPENNNSISLFNQTLQNNRLLILRKIGALVEMPSLYPHLSGFQNLELNRKLIGKINPGRTHEVLEIVKLQDVAGMAVRKYSLGMKQRLGLAITLLHDPDLLILDEPTNGLDPAGIREIRELIVELHRTHNKTIFLSSHLLDEIEKMATHVGILKAGKCVFEGKMEELQQLLRKNTMIFTVNDIVKAEAVIRQHTEYEFRILQDSHAIAIQTADDDMNATINRMLVENNISVSRIEPQSGNLESLFLELTE
jgi:ABC-2 type transport system ATP-binding protein